MPTLSAVFLDDLGRVQLTAGDLLPNVVYRIQRQTAIESTWVNVRGGQDVTAGGTTIVNDYEYTANVENTYRLTGPIFYDSFARVYPVPLEEGFETLPLGVTITEGTSPGVRMQLPGAAADFASTPDHASLDITGDIDLRAMVSFDSSKMTNTVISKNDTSNLSYSFGTLLSSVGTLRFRGSTTGATFNVTAPSSVGLHSINGYYDRKPIAIRVTRVAATGVVQFFTSDSIDGPWTQLGTNIIGTAGNLFSGNAPLRVGNLLPSTPDPARADVYQVQVRSGINGTVEANPDFAGETPGTLNFNDSTGKTWTLNGAAAIVDTVQSSGAWARTMAQAHTGSWSLQSAMITDNEVSDAVLQLPADATSLTFWYRVDSEDDFDFLQVLIDDDLVLSATGSVDWIESALLDVSSASTVTFRYFKDGSVSEGDDAAWIDDLTINLASSGVGWGTADTGQTYVTNLLDPGASLSVNNGVGVVNSPTPLTDAAWQLVDTAPGATDAEVLYSAIQPSASLDVSVEYNVGLRATDSANYYEVQPIFTAAGNVQVRLSKRVGGIFTSLVSLVTVGTWQEDIPWHVRFRVEGSTLQARLWMNGTAEPNAWQVSTTDTDLVSGSALHIRARKNGGDAYEQWYGPIEVNSIPVTALDSVSVTPAQEEVMLKSVEFPSLNRALDCVDWDALTRNSRAGFFNIKGRHEILSIADVGSSATFNLTFITRSRAENRAVVALLSFGGVLLLQPPGDSDEDCQFGTFDGIPGGYVTPSASVQNHSVHGQPIWQWTVTFTRVAAPPADIVGTTITWQQLWEIIGPEGTWEDVWATWPTWQALWSTTGGVDPFFEA